MRLIMLTDISGSRGDEMWPHRGEQLICGETEGRHLIASGLAAEDTSPVKETPVTPEEPKGTWPPPAETAVVPEENVEVRTPEPEQKEPVSPLADIAPRRGPGRPRKDSLPK